MYFISILVCSARAEYLHAVFHPCTRHLRKYIDTLPEERWCYYVPYSNMVSIHMPTLEWPLKRRSGPGCEVELLACVSEGVLCLGSMYQASFHQARPCWIKYYIVVYPWLCVPTIFFFFFFPFPCTTQGWDPTKLRPSLYLANIRSERNLEPGVVK